MDKLQIEAIINFTRQRDVDSLDSCLLEFLANFTSSNSILLYTLNHDDDNEIKDNLIRLLKLSPSKNNQYQINKELKKVTIDKDICSCIEKQSITRINLGDEYTRLLIPIKQDSKISRILDIELNQDNSFSHQYLNSVVEVYKNLFLTLHNVETDYLTKLYNKWVYNNKLNVLLENQKKKQNNCHLLFKNIEKRSISDESTSWLAIFDIDNFKNVNDTHGHLFGDEVILIIAQKMRRFFRNTDLLFRFGGEEFLVILEPVPKKMAHLTFSRFCNIIAEYKFPQIEKVTVSLGYTKITINNNSYRIFDCADKALYYAKEHGKNCVCNYEELLDKKLLTENKKIEPTELFD